MGARAAAAEDKCLETWEILDVGVDWDIAKFKEKEEGCERLRMILDSMVNRRLFRFLKNSKIIAFHGSSCEGFLLKGFPASSRLRYVVVFAMLNLSMETV